MCLTQNLYSSFSPLHCFEQSEIYLAVDIILLTAMLKVFTPKEELCVSFLPYLHSLLFYLPILRNALSNLVFLSNYYFLACHHIDIDIAQAQRELQTWFL